MIVVNEFTIVSRDSETTYEVRRSQQPWHNWLAAKLFHHLVDEPLTPVIFWVSNHLPHRRYTLDENDIRLPLDVKIELRCYDLGEKNARLIDAWPINKATFNQLSKYPDILEKLGK